MSPDESKKSIIVYIEDDELLAELMQKRCQQEGWKVEVVTNASEGIEKIRTASPDLVLLDLLLPGAEGESSRIEPRGYDLLKQMKADKDLASIPVIIFSNLGEEEEVVRGMNLGAVEFLVKAQTGLNDVVEKIRAKIS